MSRQFPGKILPANGNHARPAAFLSKATGTIKMSDTQNMKIMQTYIDSLGKGDMEMVGKLLADDVLWHQPGSSHLSGLHSGKSTSDRL